jgi:hypothetical protein
LRKHGIPRRDPNHRDAGYRDKEVLSHHYEKENMTIAEIATFYDVSGGVINDWLKKFNIPRRQAGQQVGKPVSDKKRKSMEPFWQSLKGRKLSQETRRKLSLAMSGINHPNYGKKMKHPGRYWVQCQDGSHVCMRSNWEVTYSEWLTENGYEWMYEPETFVLNDGSAYTPDFWVPRLNAYIEVKGWMRDEHKKKIDSFRSNYPELSLIIANKEYLQNIECDLFSKHESHKPTMKCAFCEIEFSPKSRTQKMCSIRCRNKFVAINRWDKR